jgi:trans-aconitate methyltransferase
VAEWKLFEDDTIPEHTTASWYAARERAAHLEQPDHKERLLAAARLVDWAVTSLMPPSIVPTVVDLGCGDGGLLSLLKSSHVPCRAWGYDLQPSNIRPAVAARHVDARYGDIWGPQIEWGNVAVATEVLEHLTAPQLFVQRVAEHSRILIASSPAFESPDAHYPFHTWAWDKAGYVELLNAGGFTVVKHDIVGGAQVVAGVRS